MGQGLGGGMGQGLGKEMGQVMSGSMDRVAAMLARYQAPIMATFSAAAIATAFLLDASPLSQLLPPSTPGGQTEQELRWFLRPVLPPTLASKPTSPSGRTWCVASASAERTTPWCPSHLSSSPRSQINKSSILDGMLLSAATSISHQSHPTTVRTHPQSTIIHNQQQIIHQNSTYQ